MKYTQKQLRDMIKEYFIQVHEATEWNRYDNKEMNEYVRKCRYKVMENYLPASTTHADVLFLLVGNTGYFRVFLINNGKLEELHQKHESEYCLTCLKDDGIDKETQSESVPF